MAQQATEIRTVRRLSNRTTETARGLPADVLASGVDTAALGRIQADADKLTGTEMAAIARDIAGPPVNESRKPATGGPGEGNGPSTDGPATTTVVNTTVAAGNASEGPEPAPR